MDVQPGRCRTPPFTQGPGRTSLGHAESECPASHPKGRDTRSPAMKTQNARPFTEGSGYTFLRPRTPRMPHPTPRGRSERRTPHPSHRGGAYILHVRGLCLLHRAGIGRLSPRNRVPLFLNYSLSAAAGLAAFLRTAAFHCSRPMPAADFAAFLQRQRSTVPGPGLPAPAGLAAFLPTAQSRCFATSLTAAPGDRRG